MLTFEPTRDVLKALFGLAMLSADERPSRVLALVDLVDAASGTKAGDGIAEVVDLAFRNVAEVVEAGDRNPDVLSQLAWIVGRRAERFELWPLAREAYVLAVRLLEGAEDPGQLPLIWRDLGDAWRGEGHFERAHDCYLRAAGLLEPNNDVTTQIEVLGALLRAEGRAGSTAQVDLIFQRAFAVLTEAETAAGQPSLAEVSASTTDDGTTVAAPARGEQSTTIEPVPSSDNPVGNAAILLGGWAIEIGRYEHGRAAYELALRALEQAGDSTLFGAIWHYVGDSWLLSGDARRAVECYRRAIELKGAGHDPLDRARSYVSLVTAEVAAGASDESILSGLAGALGSIEASVDGMATNSGEAVDSRPALGMAANHAQTVGRQAEQLEKYPLARRAYEFAADLYERTDDTSSLSVAWRDIGDTWRGERDSRAAATCYRRALDFGFAGDPVECAQTSGLLAEAEIANGASTEADAVLQSALRRLGEAVKPAVRDRDGESAIVDMPAAARVAHQLGRRAESLRRFEAARSAYVLAISLFDDLGTLGLAGIAWHDLGDVLVAEGNVGEAVACYRRAVELKETDHDPLDLVTSLRALARAEASLGDGQPVRRTLRAALNELSRVFDAEASDVSPLTQCAHEVAQDAMALGDFEAAREAFLLVARLCERQGDRAAVAAAWHNIGAAWQIEGDAASAIEAYGRSLQLSRLLGLSRARVMSLTMLADAEATRGSLEARDASLREALDTLAAMEGADTDRAATAQQVHLVGRTAERLHSFALAREAYTLVVQLLDGSGPVELIATAWCDIGDVWRAENDPAQAVASYEHALDLIPPDDPEFMRLRTLAALGAAQFEAGRTGEAHQTLCASLELTTRAFAAVEADDQRVARLAACTSELSELAASFGYEELAEAARRLVASQPNTEEPL